MSIFGKINRSRKAAKEHKASATKEKGPEKVVQNPPYKHVPTHAAVDALSGAPSSWNQNDRPRIREQHKRRSEMNFSRRASSSNASAYNQVAAGPSASIPPLPRNSSYSSFNPPWFDRSSDLLTSDNKLGEPRQSRYKASGGPSHHDSGIGRSPLASHVQSEEASPVVSSGHSTHSNSSGTLEIARPANRQRLSSSPRSQAIIYAEQDIFARLHTSTTRKLGEAPIRDSPAPKTKDAMAPVVEKKKILWSTRKSEA
ncbi:unnamed protein product [Diplocarpon coronariae]|uniref:Uncharacterized protein n=1 Tax=Diplocarpon coronariae TaxID=2795749 RepID=A0A218YXT4_9HELO|nr:hypothetical protein B2J93_8704 [Marssonina coronariae]